VGDTLNNCIPTKIAIKMIDECFCCLPVEQRRSSNGAATLSRNEEEGFDDGYFTCYE